MFFFVFTALCVGKKKARRVRRAHKAAAIAPRPLAGALRPVVRPGGRRHNHRVRLGRGFSVTEVKKAGLTPQFASTIGIAVDKRRKNTSEEALAVNVQRLKTYRAKLVLFPKAASKQKKIGKARKAEPVATAEERKNATQHRGALFPVPFKQPVVQQARPIRPEELLPKNSQYLRARRARADARLVGERVRRADIRAKKAELAAAGGGKKQVQDVE